MIRCASSKNVPWFILWLFIRIIFVHRKFSSDMLTVFDISGSFGFIIALWAHINTSQGCCCCYYYCCCLVLFTRWFWFFFFSSRLAGVAIGLSLATATESEPAHQPISSLADTAYPKQNQYFDSTNMAYVLELSNSKTNQNNGGEEDDEEDNRSSNDSHNIRSSQKFVTVSSRDNDDADKMNNALNRGPFFDVSASKNVTALVGKTANLNCRIKNLGNKTVSFFFFSRWTRLCARFHNFSLSTLQHFKR